MFRACRAPATMIYVYVPRPDDDNTSNRHLANNVSARNVNDSVSASTSPSNSNRTTSEKTLGGLKAAPRRRAPPHGLNIHMELAMKLMMRIIRT